jgi:hypothetical protein
MISWGNGNSVTVEGFRPKDLTAADFTFAPAPALTLMSFAKTSGTDTMAATGNSMIAGAIAATGRASIAALPPASVASDSTGLTSESVGATGITGATVESGTPLAGSTMDVAHSALGGEVRESPSSSLSGGTTALTAPPLLSLDGYGSGAAHSSGAMLPDQLHPSFSPVTTTAPFAAPAMGVAMPSADALLATLHVGTGGSTADKLDGASGTAGALPGLTDLIEGGGHATDIDALLAAIPGHGGSSLGAPIGGEDMALSHFLPAPGMFTAEAMVVHADAVTVG